MLEFVSPDVVRMFFFSTSSVPLQWFGHSVAALPPSHLLYIFNGAHVYLIACLWLATTNATSFDEASHHSTSQNIAKHSMFCFVIHDMHDFF